MTRLSLAVVTAVLCVLAAVTAGRTQQADDAAAVRFAAVDVFIDSVEPLAAWQFELTERNGSMSVVGVENGESDVYASAPYYDLEAVRRGEAERLIVADFSLSADSSLPVGRTRVATIHVRLSGAQAPDYRIRLIAAGGVSGRPIDAAIALNAQTEE